MKGVFEISGSSRYDDLIAERYHFPRVYLQAATACVDDWNVYRETGSGGGRKAYVAAAFVDRIDREGPNRSDPGAFAYDVGVYCQYRGKQCNKLRGDAYRFEQAWNARAESDNMRRIQSVYRREAQDPEVRTKCLQQKSESIRRATYGQQDWYYDGKC